MASFIVILLYHYPVHISLPLRKISTPITKVDFTNHHYKYQHEQQQLRCIFRVFHYYFLVLNQFSHESPHKTQHFKIEKKSNLIEESFLKRQNAKITFWAFQKKKQILLTFAILFSIWKNNKGTISNFFIFFIFWITVLLMGSPNNTFENLVFMKWWNGESFDTQKWQIHLGPPDDELIQLIFIFIMHLLMAIWWCVWLKFKKTGPLLIYIHSK